MLYVFQVDTGTMMTFDMRLAFEKVANLKRAIFMRTDIPEDKQVLLISGGESLSNMQTVCSHSSAGTDTSPIFLFAKINIESNMPPVLNVDYDDDRDIMEMIESCLSMQPSLDTLVARTELAADLNEQAIKKRESCERLVHEQHLQQQGWAAVTANLDDLTRAFKNKSELLMSHFTNFTKFRTKHEELLHKFSDDIKRLDSVPILPLLLEDNKYLASLSANINKTSCDSHPAPKPTSSTTNKQRSETTSNQAQAPRSIDEQSSLNETSEKDADSDDSKVEKRQPSTPSSKLDTTTPLLSTNPASPASEDADSTATTNDDETKQSEDEFLDAENQETESLLTTAATAPTTDSKKESETQPGETISGTTTAATNNIETSDQSDQCQNNSVSLRHWIDLHDSDNSLEKLVDLCWRGLERCSEAKAEQLKHEVQELLKAINDVSMKVIKGLEERLFTLDKLMDDTKKVVEDQSQLSASFQNNRERFSKVKDSSLLPDLSESHKQQLQIMLSNHKKMIDVRNRCIKAKHELCLSLHSRLRWIMYIEQQISDLDGKLMIYRENLRRLQRNFDIVEQVQKAPEIYLSTVVEALRRRKFTKRYLHWANSVARISQKLYDNEMATRKSFDEKLGNHFLCTLFPGLTRSYPPPFATRQPDPFDTNLPRITAADIQYLQANVSEELARNLFIPRDVHIPHEISALTANDADDDVVNEDADDDGADDDDDDRHSLNPTPPSSPATKHRQ